MIGFGLRLTLRGGREAAVRLVVTAAAVALGVGLLLVTLAALNGVHAQNSRYAWLNSGNPGAIVPGSPVSPDPLWGTEGTDFYAGKSITRVDVAATGPQSPVPPGIPRLPGPGEYYASPALSALLASVPANQLADRYPGRQIGTIGEVALPAPNSLIVIVGRSADELSALPGAAQVTSIATKDPGSCDGCRYGTSTRGIDLILSVASAALFFPILMFIGTATRLSAARREQRFAAMRLVGATPRQVSVVSAVESTVAAIAGTAAGFGLFFLLRIPLGGVAFTGEPFAPGDLSLRLTDVLLVAIGVPLAAALVARIALRRVRISPLGVSRRVTPRPPRAYRVIPLLLGIAELAYFVGRRPPTTDGQIRAYLTGIFLMLFGLVLAGPWLTMAGSRLVARRANRPATLIAGRRLADNPQAGFRAVSGLVLALFVTSTALGVITTITAQRGAPDTAAARDTVLVDTSRFEGGHQVSTTMIPDPLLAKVTAIRGVQGTMVIHTNPLGTTVPAGQWQMEAGLVSCAQFATISGYGYCAPGAEVASIPTYLSGFNNESDSWNTTVWPTAAMSAAQLESLPALGVVVSTDGSVSANEQAKTVLGTALPGVAAAATVTEIRSDFGSVKQLAGFQQLANVVILVSLCIAGCSLAVSVVGGLNDRKRPFSLLRLTGVQLNMLRRIVLLETTVPLLVISAVAAGAGFLAAALFLRSEMSYPLSPPGVSYYVTVVAGLAVSLAVIACTLPLLKRITGPETARNE